MTNAKITIYHKTINSTTKLEEYTRYNYNKAWIFAKKGTSLNEAYSENNIAQIRIFYDDISNLDINNFSRGDIVVNGETTIDITKKTDIKGYDIYNITGITDNKYGGSPHIHLEAQ